ncbi:hypothetical protein MKK67_02715 [Methylobacterium sp. J-072]|uniref:PXPV repeat-containing protein n=1 Tax=Methylobacterium pseudosasicola TaxID=582667 RepID=A0A1I4F3W5_9HYPH|nr:MULTISPECIES: hypothetical protein [Methylobacterium]MCJ2091425.1 hypothetical protein [Methylobacterium sp. J-072]SFL12249.1 hypothetical protein SAMN05192568_100160 [Methylobacterium pseudosasicola]
MLRKFLLAALLVLGFAAAAPQGASAAPVGPGIALPADAAPAVAQKAQYYYRRRFYGPRPFYRRPYYRRRFYYGPRPFYRRPYYRRRFYY